jgi:TsgA-like MFS transporter
VNASLRVTLACFLAYCVMSGMLSPIGVLMPALAEQFSIGVVEAARLFSWLTVGILVGSALSLLAFDVLSLRLAMLLVYALVVASLLALRLFDVDWLLRAALGVVGACCGIGLAAAASTITLLYSAERRASMLVITDGAFSISGALTASLAVPLVAGGLHWASTYLLVAALAALVVFLVASSPFPAAPRAQPVQAAAQRGSWPLAVWLCALALFLYTLGQYSLLWWLPTHLEQSLGIARDAAGVVVARYWSGMLAGQLLVAWWVLRLGVRRMVVLSILGTLGGSLPLWLVSRGDWLPWLALGWGVINFGLLKVVISLGSESLAQPTPRLLAALLFGATSGTAVSPLVTSLVAGYAGTLRVLQFGSFCYLVMAGLVIVALLQRSPVPALCAEEDMS